MSPRERILCAGLAAAALGLIAAPCDAAPHTLVVPAVASIHGARGTFFRSDVHLFNHANVSTTVQLTYRCWAGQSCGSPASLVLPPRGNRRVADVVNSLFAAPETAGALEVVYDDANGSVTARSRVYTDGYGQGVPGLEPGAALRVSLINFVPLSAAMRSNSGIYNPNDVPAQVGFELHRGDGSVIGTSSHTAAARESYQFALSAPADEPDAYLIVTSDQPLFAYVSAVDNVTGDAVFVTPSDDSRTGGAAELVVECSRYRFSPGSAPTPIVLIAGASYRLRFHSLDVTHGMSAIPQLGIGGGEFAPDSDYVVDVTVPLSLRGSRFNFACTHICGSGHGNMYGAIEVR